MSNIIPPMVSSSPPPMDDNLDDEDEDDEFGTFSTADFSYELDVTQPSKPSLNGVQDNNIRDQCDLKNIIHVESVEKEVLNYSSDSDFLQQNGTHSPSEIFPVLETTEGEEVPGGDEQFTGSQKAQQENTSRFSSRVKSGLQVGPSAETYSLPSIEQSLRKSIPDHTSQEQPSSIDETVTYIDSDPTLSDGIQLAVNGEIQSPLMQRPSSILNDSKCIEKHLNYSDQNNGETRKDQLPINCHDPSRHSIVEDYVEVSDCRLDRNEMLSDKSLTCVLSGSCINDGSTANITEHLSVVGSSLKHGQLHSTDSSKVACEVPSLNEPSKHFSQEINISVGPLLNEALELSDQSRFKPDRVSGCDDADFGKVVGVISSSSFGDKSSIFGTSNPTTDGEPCHNEKDECRYFENISPKPPFETNDICDNIENFGFSEASSLPSAKKISTILEVVNTGDEFGDFACSEAPSLSLTTTSININNESDDEFADFACSVQSSLPLTTTTTNEVFDADDEFADFACGVDVSLTVTDDAVKKTNESIECDDGFADFANSVATSFPSTAKIEESRWANMTSQQIYPDPIVADQLDDDFDDFDDFESAHFLSAVVPAAVDSQLSSRLENVVTTLFPGPGKAETAMNSAVFTSRGPMVDQNPVWGDLQDVDTSHALTYQWVSSSANKMLLSALGIDTRNILFGSKWNVAVPRFAANLGVSPLEPVRARSPPLLLATGDSSPKPSQLHSEATTSTTHSEEIVPDAQFDWNSSGLVNPLDCMEKDGDRTAAGGQRTGNNGRQLLTTESYGSRTGLTLEAVKVLESLPNLSFLRSKTLVFPPPGQTVLQR